MVVADIVEKLYSIFNVLSVSQEAVNLSAFYGHPGYQDIDSSLFDKVQ